MLVYEDYCHARNWNYVEWIPIVDVYGVIYHLDFIRKREYEHVLVLKIEKFSLKWIDLCALVVYDLYGNMWVC